MSSTTPNGPSAAVFSTVERSPSGVVIRLLLLMPIIEKLTLHVRLLGRQRHALTDSSGNCIFDKEIPITLHRSRPETRCVLDAMSHFVSPRMALFDAAIEFDLKTYDRATFFGLFAGASSPDWQRLPDTYILETRKGELTSSDCELGSGFLMRTRGDATLRFNHLFETHDFLQSNQEHVVDAATELFFRLISGQGPF